MDLHCLCAILRCVNESIDWKEMMKQAKDKVLEFLKSAFRLITGLPRLMKKVREEHLLKIHKYLEKNEGLANDNEEVKKTLKMVIPIKHCLEDAIDHYELLLQSRKLLRDEDNQSNNFLIKLKKRLQLRVLYVKQVKAMYDIASTVAQMETVLQEAQLGSSSNDDINHDEADPRKEFDYGEWTRLPETEEYYLVGLDGPKKEIIQLLDLELEKSPSLSKYRYLVAVVGEGGIGKTTLAKNVYEEVRSQFDLSASVTVSQTYKPEVILKEILKQFVPTHNVEELKNVEKLKSVEEIIPAFKKLINISNKRYIVVLDDVWDSNLCDDIQKALACAQKGSRILLTTRLETEVARHWCRFLVGRTYKCQPMSEDDALKLLCRKVFKTDDCNEITKRSLRQTIQRCPLLPLIISVIGGLLSEDGSNWNAVSENLGRELRGVEGIYERTKKILLYSYYDLPHEIILFFVLWHVS